MFMIMDHVYHVVMVVLFVVMLPTALVVWEECLMKIIHVAHVYHCVKLVSLQPNAAPVFLVTTWMVLIVNLVLPPALLAV
jgi:hypothetical protein